jgi:hypothetical protein
MRKRKEKSVSKQSHALHCAPINDLQAVLKVPPPHPPTYLTWKGQGGGGMPQNPKLNFQCWIYGGQVGIYGRVMGVGAIVTN